MFHAPPIPRRPAITSMTSIQAAAPRLPPLCGTSRLRDPSRSNERLMGGGITSPWSSERPLRPRRRLHAWPLATLDEAPTPGHATTTATCRAFPLHLETVVQERSTTRLLGHQTTALSAYDAPNACSSTLDGTLTVSTPRHALQSPHDRRRSDSRLCTG